MRFKMLLILASLLFATDAFSTIKIAIPNRISNLNPQNVRIAQELFMLPLVYEGLFSLSDEGLVRPEIATRWTYDDHRKLMTISIGKEHKFSDGSLVDPDTIIAALKAMCKKGNSLAVHLYGIKNCGTERPAEIMRTNHADEIQIEITKSPNNLLFRLASGRALIFKESHAGEVLGSGPYIVSAIESEKTILSANPHFKSEKPREPLEFFTVNDKDLKAELFRGQNLDVASMYLGSTIEGLNVANYETIKYSPVITQMLILNTDVYPFNRKQFRAELYRKLTRANYEKCRPGVVSSNGGIIPSGIGGSFTDSTVGADSIDESQLPKISSNTSVTFIRHSGRANSCEENIIMEAGRAMGLTIKFKYLDDYPKLLEIYRKKGADGYLELTVFNRDASQILHRFIPGNPNPLFYYTDTKIHGLLEKSWEQKNLSDRFSFYRKINQLVKERASVIPLYYEGHTNLLRSCLKEPTHERMLVKLNPNSFLFLKDLRNGCQPKVDKQ